MKRILSLVEHLNSFKDRQKEFNAFKGLDDNCEELLNRIKAIELRNMKYFCTVQSNQIQLIIPAGLVVTFNITVYPQFGNMHNNTGVDNANVYIRRNGVYHLAAGVQIEGGAGPTFREARILVTRDGVINTVVLTRLPNVAINMAWTLSRSMYLYTGDIVQLYLGHDGVASFDLMADTDLGTPFLSVSERMEDLDPNQYGLLNPEENMR